MRRVSPLERIRLFGRAGLDVVAALGRSTLFLGHALLGRRTPGTGLHLLVKQLYSVGVCRWRSSSSRACSLAWCWPCRATTS